MSGAAYVGWFHYTVQGVQPGNFTGVLQFMPSVSFPKTKSQIYVKYNLQGIREQENIQGSHLTKSIVSVFLKEVQIRTYLLPRCASQRSGCRLHVFSLLCSLTFGDLQSLTCIHLSPYLLFYLLFSNSMPLSQFTSAVSHIDYQNSLPLDSLKTI